MDAEEKKLYTAIIIAILTLSGILGYFIFSIVRQQMRYRRLARAKINAEIITLENERQRIAGDLHDEVGPLLSAIKLQINHLEPADEHEKQLVEKSGRYIDDVIKRMREISNDLLPNILVRKGIIAAIDDYINKVQGLKKLSIQFTHQGTERLPQNIEINLYRMMQEIVHNTIKHADANNLHIQLIIQPGLVRLATDDDGVGFNMEDRLHGATGLGLLTLQSRAEVMGGELVAESAPGKGTRYLLELNHKQTQ